MSKNLEIRLIIRQKNKDRKYLRSLLLGLKNEYENTKIDIEKLKNNLTKEEKARIKESYDFFLYKDGRVCVYLKNTKSEFGTVPGIQLLFRFSINKRGVPKNFEFDQYEKESKKLGLLAFDLLKKVDYFNKMKSQFEIETFSEKELKQYKLLQTEKRAAREKEEKIIEILTAESEISNLTARRVLNISERKKVFPVKQAEYVFIDKKNAERYVETISAGPCILISMYCKENQELALCHMDAICDTKMTLYIMRNHFKKDDIEINILGGNMSSMNQMVEIYEYFEQEGMLENVSEWDIWNTTKSIIIDKTTGEVSTVTNTNKKYTGNDYDVNPFEINERSMKLYHEEKKPAKRSFFRPE